MERPRRQRLEMTDLFRYPMGVDRETIWLYLDHARFLVRKGRADAETWLKKANYEYHLGSFHEALSSAHEALAASPGSTEALFLKGVCLQLLAREAGGADLSRAVTPKARNLLEESRDAFELLLLLNPEDDEARHHRDLARTLLGEPAEG